MSHHVKTMHRDKQCACSLCQRSYVSKIGLNEHVDKVHKKLIKYQCEICGKDFFGRSLYLDHVAAHTGVKIYTCLICVMGFMNKGAFKKTCFTFSSERRRDNFVSMHKCLYTLCFSMCLFGEINK